MQIQVPVQALLFVIAFAGCTSWRLNPHAARLNQRGAARLRDSDWQQAEAAFRLALELDPAYAAARSNLALVRFRLGDLESAEREAESATRLRSDIAEPWNLLGAIAEQRGNKHVAAESFEHALLIDPTYLEARVNLVRVLVELGDSDAARAHAERVAEIEETPSIGSALLAILEAQAGDYSQARNHAQRVLVVLTETSERHPSRSNTSRVESMAETLGINFEDDPEDRLREQRSARRHHAATEACGYAHFALAIADTLEQRPDLAQRHLAATRSVPSLQTAASQLGMRLDREPQHNDFRCDI